jgi:hypothetical protein
MAVTLAVIERTHRGTVEQQYAHVLWLVHSLHAQVPMCVLLRGPAVVYALAGPPPEPVRVGDIPWGVYPDYQAAIGRLLADGAEVHVSASGLQALGLAEYPLLSGVVAVSDEELIGLIGRCDRWWHL